MLFFPNRVGVGEGFLTFYKEKSCLLELNRMLIFNYESVWLPFWNLDNEWCWGPVSMHSALGWESSQNCPVIMSSYLNHTENSTWKAAGSEIRNQWLLGWLHLLWLQDFHSQCLLTSDWLSASPPCFFFALHFIYFGSWQSHFGNFLNSQDPVCLLTSNYSCAELLKNEMSSNKQSGCPLTCMLYGYFASSQLFIKQLFRLLAEEHFDVSGYVILAFFICCRMTCCNLTDELCSIERSRQLRARRGYLVITSCPEECSQWLLCYTIFIAHNANRTKVVLSYPWWSWVWHSLITHICQVNWWVGFSFWG